MTNTAIVHIVDDDPGVCRSLRLLMESASLTVRAYDSGQEFLDTVDPHKPGCIVLDLRMPDMGGLEILQRLRAAHNQIPVIIISGHVDVPTAIRSMKLGAIDLLQKPFEPQVLLDTVRSALGKSIELQRRRSEQAVARERLAKLTPREFELLKLIAAGLPNKKIAADLRISIKTVANHRAKLMEKAQALNAADLVRMSILAGVVPSEAAGHE